jgi:hypothetical protein
MVSIDLGADVVIGSDDADHSSIISPPHFEIKGYTSRNTSTIENIIKRGDEKLTHLFCLVSPDFVCI